MGLSDDLLPDLASRLREIGYTHEGVRGLLGISYPDDVGPLNRAPTAERLRTDDTALATAARLWFLELAVPRRSLARALGADLVDCLQRARLLSVSAGAVSARLRIDVVDDLHLLADRRFGRPDAAAFGLPRGDMVYPPGSDSVLLRQAIPTGPCGAVLDLCTGSGIQGLSAAREASSVTAVDVSPRCVALAGANARMSSIVNFEAVQGDLFRPVRHGSFDLILANPPFVPSPKRGPSYHSGGPRGDRVLRRVLEGLPSHLRPQGRALVISHLALREGEQVASALAPWLSGFDGRVLVLLLDSGSAVDLAAAQAVFALDEGFAGYAAEVRSWVRYLDRHRVEKVLLLLIAAQRSGRPALEVREAFQRTFPLPLSRPAHDLVAEWFAGR